MKKLSILWMLTLVLTGVATLAGCSSSDDDQSSQDDYQYELMGLTRKRAMTNGSGIVVKIFERNGMKLQVVDITDQFESAYYFNNKKIPVNHVYVEQLPTAIQERVVVSGNTRICRMEYEGEYYYDIFSMFSSSWTNLYNSKGERHDFNTTEEHKAFMNKVKDLSCILVLATEVVKDAEGAPNYLVGYWQNDWQHLTHGDQQATVALYPDCPSASPR